MRLENVIPWGRSLQEYREMFALTDEDFKKKILGCADGPASFNADLTRLGGQITSVDPLYRFSAEQIRQRIGAVYPVVMDQMAENADKYIWTTITSIPDLGKKRMKAMHAFIDDFATGTQAKRYIDASLPVLPFQDRDFQLALCSHYLFLYSEQVPLDHHQQAIEELCRVADEVRIYPLLTLSGEPSPYLTPVIEELEKKAMTARIVPVSYQFQKGATEMLLVQHLPTACSGG
ncbi:MAG: SAM-dependent methyltransferase [Desulfobulbus sp.]|nr:MAG: SAM-dependent methyltransferase [Desulfobulbus sp.]